MLLQGELGMNYKTILATIATMMASAITPTIFAASAPTWNKLIKAIQDGDLSTVQALMPVRGPRAIQPNEATHAGKTPLKMAQYEYAQARGVKKAKIQKVLIYINNLAKSPVAPKSIVPTRAALKPVVLKKPVAAKQVAPKIAMLKKPLQAKPIQLKPIQLKPVRVQPKPAQRLPIGVKKPTIVPRKTIVTPVKLIPAANNKPVWDRLIKAIERDDVTAVAAIVPAHIAPSERTKIHGRTPIQMAHYGNARKVIAYLQGLQAGAPARGQMQPAVATGNVLYFYDKAKPYYELTNFWYDPTKPRNLFKLKGMNWPTSEHYFQAQKFSNNPGIVQAIIKAPSARDAFDVAQQNNAAVDPSWHKGNPPRKEQVMYEALQAKFTQNPALRALLLSTGNAQLVEASPVDAYWGTGPIINGKWQGKNRLGILLMRLRTEMHLGKI